jgi:hypothetical protein
MNVHENDSIEHNNNGNKKDPINDEIRPGVVGNIET